MRRVLLLTILSIVTAMLGLSFAQSSTNSEIAQAGKLRVGMNPATAVLLTRTPEQGITGGVGFELGKFIARKVGAVLELAAYPGSDSFSQSYGKNEWDIAFGSKTPLVEDKADFIADVLLNDYWFIAAPGREFANAAQVDRPGVKVGAGLNSSSDQFLSKTLKSAQLVRLTGGRSVEALSKGEVDVWAASASAIEEVLKRLPKAKIVPGNFTSERTMVILPKGRSAAAQARIREIINEAKKAGVVRKALEQTGTKGVRAAP